MPVSVILQARSASTRLSSKIYKDLNGKTMLEQILIRLKKASGVGDVVIATVLEDEEKIRSLADPLGCPVMAGPVDDVLSRYLNILEHTKDDYFIRTTADNPLVEYTTIGDMAGLARKGEYDYFYPDGLPYGAGFEVVRTGALKELKTRNLTDSDREHVTLFIREHTELFKTGCQMVRESLVCPDLRVTVDTPEDLLNMRRFYADFCGPDGIADLEQVIKFNHLLKR